MSARANVLLIASVWLCCGASSAYAAPQHTAPSAWAAIEGAVQTRKVCVMRFPGKGGDPLRQVVLDALSQHTEVEVIGVNDVEVSAKRLGVSMTDEHGRAVLGEDLGVYAWVDGDGARGVAWLSLSDGKRLGEVKFASSEARSGDAANVKVWSALGHFVSDVALRDHVVARRSASAESKLAAAAAEQQKQVELALQRMERRNKHLAKLQLRAAEVLRAQTDEVTHQQTLALERAREAEAEAARQMELARKAEAAHQVELAKQAESARQMQLAQQAAIARQNELASQVTAARQAELARQAATPPPQAQPVWQQRPAPVYAQPAYTQQPAYAQPAYAQQPVYAQPVYTPPPQPVYAQPVYAQPVAAPPPSNAAPVSPETQAWLERRRAAQAAH